MELAIAAINDEKNWREVGNKLLRLLTHDRSEVRRFAASKIGWFYTQAIKQICYHDFVQEDNSTFTESEISIGLYDREQEICDRLPPLPQMFETIQALEIDGFDIAGAFVGGLGEVEKKVLSRYRRFDLNQWLWNTLERSPIPKPSETLTLTLNSLGTFIAMRFLEDVDAAQRCLAMGRKDVAYLIAMYLSACPVDGMEPILMALGYDDDPEVVRRISWQLAYYYHILHPHGARLGYVEQVQGIQEIDLFLLHSQGEAKKSPFVAIIYAQGKGNQLEDAISRKWVDCICPASKDGMPIADRDFPYEIPPTRNWQLMGFQVEYCRYDANYRPGDESPHWHSVKVWGGSYPNWNVI